MPPTTSSPRCNARLCEPHTLRIFSTAIEQALAAAAAVRLLSPRGVKIALLFASSGIENEVVSRALPVALPGAGPIPVARAEELLAMKVLSMTEQRLQDRLDARQLLAHNPRLDLEAVRQNLRTITDRGFSREQDLEKKLDSLLEG